MATNEPAVQAQVDQILAKVHEGQRISYDEGLYLYEHAELLDLGEAANARRHAPEIPATSSAIRSDAKP